MKMKQYKTLAKEVKFYKFILKSIKKVSTTLEKLHVLSAISLAFEFVIGVIEFIAKSSISRSLVYVSKITTICFVVILAATIFFEFVVDSDFIYISKNNAEIDLESIEADYTRWGMKDKTRVLLSLQQVKDLRNAGLLVFRRSNYSNNPSIIVTDGDDTVPAKVSIEEFQDFIEYFKKCNIEERDNVYSDLRLEKERLEKLKENQEKVLQIISNKLNSDCESDEQEEVSNYEV